MSTTANIDEFYRRAYGRAVEPFPYQRRLAEDADVDVLIAPTGLGKTAAVTIAWAWRRLTFPSETPRRLVWCLPMRSLVEQTAHEATCWMERLSGDFAAAGCSTPSVHVLMGGAVDQDWRLQPESPAILVGTQDMLLSRALMRGYSMSRFGWAIDFGLLHSDALWVYDEVQLMGAGLATSAQLEAFRRRSGWRHGNLARSLWVSATLDPDWLRTAEFRSEIPSPVVMRWNDGNPPEPSNLSMRLDAVKHLRRAETVLRGDDLKKPETYAQALAREVVAVHRKGATTLVIVNTVRRAQILYDALSAQVSDATERLLIHSRFRPLDRRALETSLRSGAAADRIVVATQAVEAGVDMTSAVLFTELAPWSSLVQRFGRCNRTGELTDLGGAEVRWIDVETDDDGAPARPYEPDDLRATREILSRMEEVSPRNLPPPSAPAPPAQVIRPKDFEELFDTDSDLSGYDLDISPYIRDGDDIAVSLFWREIGDEVRIVADPPRREELCAAPLGKELESWLAPKTPGRPVYVEDPLAEGRNRWIRLDRSGRRLRPGLTLMLDVTMGGYDAERGFIVSGGIKPVPVVNAIDVANPAENDTDEGGTTGDDPQSFAFERPIPLELHLSDVAAAAGKIAEAVRLPAPSVNALVRAGAWHDLGKAYLPFQALLGASGMPWLAKSSKHNGAGENGRGARPADLRKFFRHELASALGFLKQHDGEPDADLVAFLIAAHHGRVRMGLRALPEERSDEPALRLARGVQDGDVLPEVRCGEEVSSALTLDLALMEMGEDENGRPSWAARTHALLAQYGPFRLAYLEALIRMADWRASAAEQEQARRPDE